MQSFTFGVSVALCAGIASAQSFNYIEQVDGAQSFGDLGEVDAGASFNSERRDAPQDLNFTFEGSVTRQTLSHSSDLLRWDTTARDDPGFTPQEVQTDSSWRLNFSVSEDAIVDLAWDTSNAFGSYNFQGFRLERRVGVGQWETVFLLEDADPVTFDPAPPTGVESVEVFAAETYRLSGFLGVFAHADLEPRFMEATIREIPTPGAAGALGAVALYRLRRRR